MTRTLFETLGLTACAVFLAMPALAANKGAWPAETLTGKIMMVAPDASHLLVVKGPDGVPFDMVVNHATRITADGQSSTLSQLQADKGKSVTVRFVPEGAGDVAHSIQVTG